MTDLRPAALFDRLRSTYWFVPALVTLACVAAGLALVAVDRTPWGANALTGWAYGGGADGARSLLSAIAGSTITVVSVTFSVMVVALTVSSQHFGPRLLNSFMRDNPSQLVLGTFTGTFAYCLVVLRTVQGDGGDRYSIFVPHLAVTGSVVLTLLSVGMLIYYVHHIASSMQVSVITVRVADDFVRSIERMYPEQIGEPGGTAPAGFLPVPAGAARIDSEESGYLQTVDGEAILEATIGASVTLWLTARPGDFVTAGATALAAVHPAPADLEAFSDAVRNACVIGADRTSHQDVAFPAQQLSEVALRALSPGVNEPFTAMTCIDRLGQGLALLAARRQPEAVRSKGGIPRVIAAHRRFDELLHEIFEPVVLNAAPQPAVLEHVLGTLRMLDDVATRPEDREAIQSTVRQVKSFADKLDEPARSRVVSECERFSHRRHFASRPQIP